MTGVDCVVVNYNAGERLAHCVSDLLAQQPPVAVTVVDNASTDDSLPALEAATRGESRLHVTRNRDNSGFGAACNQGAAATGAPFLAFINPDVRLPPDALRGLVAALESAPRAALAGALVRDPDGGIQRGTLRRLPTPWRSLMTFTGLERLASRFPALAGIHESRPASGEPAVVEAVNGACLLVRREAFQSVGGFDPGYFLHCEDLDLFRRLRAAGHHILLAPVDVTHYRGTPSRSAPMTVHWHKHRSMLRYLWRHHGRGIDMVWLPPAMLGIAVRWLLLAPAAWLAGRRSGGEAR